MSKKSKDPKAFETLPVWVQTKDAIRALVEEENQVSDYPVTVSPLLEKCIQAYREKRSLVTP